MIENKNYISEIETPEGEILVVRDAGYENITVYNSKELKDAISKATPNTTIILDIKEGEENPYNELLTLTTKANNSQKINKNYPEAVSFPSNLTIIGKENIKIYGISITSGVQMKEIWDQSYGDIVRNSDVSNSYVSNNLVLKGLNFERSFSLRNCNMTGLIIQDCTFGTGANIQLVPNLSNDQYGNDGSGSLEIIPTYALRKVKDIIISGCKFANADKSITSEISCAIYAKTVENVTVYNNTIENAAANGIQITGSSGYKKLKTTGNILYIDGYTTGKIDITNNNIKKSGSRGIRLSYMKDAYISVESNQLAQTDQSEETPNPEKIKLSHFYPETTIRRWNDNYCDNIKIILDDGISETDQQYTKINEQIKDFSSEVETIIENKYEDIYTYIVANLPRYTGEENA